MFYLKQKWFGNTLFLSIFVMCSKRWYIEMESCTTNERVSIPRWKWTSVEHWALVCEILVPLWNTGRGWGHTSHTHAHKHTYTARLSRATQINCFQAARPFCFYWDQNIIQEAGLSRRAMLTPTLCEPSFFIRHVQFFTITITYLQLYVCQMRTAYGVFSYYANMWLVTCMNVVQNFDADLNLLLCKACRNNHASMKSPCRFLFSF